MTKLESTADAATAICSGSPGASLFYPARRLKPAGEPLGVGENDPGTLERDGVLSVREDSLEFLVFTNR